MFQKRKCVEICDCLGEKGCNKYDRSHQEPSNEYLVAKIGVDTDENEPLKVRSIFKLRDSIFADPPRPSNVREGEGSSQPLDPSTSGTLTSRFAAPSRRLLAPVGRPIASLPRTSKL